MDLKPHLINITKLISIRVNINFLKPVNAKDFNNRKDMTYKLQHVIDNFYSNGLNNTKFK